MIRVFNVIHTLNKNPIRVLANNQESAEQCSFKYYEFFQCRYTNILTMSFFKLFYFTIICCNLTFLSLPSSQILTSDKPRQLAPIIWGSQAAQFLKQNTPSLSSSSNTVYVYYWSTKWSQWLVTPTKIEATSTVREIIKKVVEKSQG